VAATQKNDTESCLSGASRATTLLEDAMRNPPKRPKSPRFPCTCAHARYPPLGGVCYSRLADYPSPCTPGQCEYRAYVMTLIGAVPKFRQCTCLIDVRGRQLWHTSGIGSMWKRVCLSAPLPSLRNGGGVGHGTARDSKARSVHQEKRTPPRFSCRGTTT
jgi:hypothetical protein